MPEEFAGVVVNELRRLKDSLDQVGSQLEGKKTLTPSERASVTEAYSSLKDELRRLHEFGTVGGIRRDQSESEERFFAPAVNRALQALRAPTNTNPLSSKWSALLSEAASEISYQLHRLEKELEQARRL